MRPELGVGPLAAPVWIIGRDFGEHEERAREPFVGPAGALLNRALATAGFDVRWDRHGQRTYLDPRLRIDNLVPERPPGNDFARHRPGAVSEGMLRLGRLLHAAKPKLIVALGNEASAFLLGDQWPVDKRGQAEGIQQVRGYLWDTEFGRVLTTVHPAGILREWTPWRALLDLDLKKAARELRDGCPPLPHREVVVVTNAGELADLHDAIRCEGLVGGVAGRPSLGSPGRRWLAVDIENHDVGEPQPLACVGFAPTPERAWVVPAVSDAQRAAIRALVESDVPKVLQNGQYDRFFLRWYCGMTLRGQTFDTMLGWHAAQPELAGKKTAGPRKSGGRRTVKSLAFLAGLLTREPWYKNYDFASEDDRYRLCGVDCCVTHEIAGRLAAMLEAE